MTAELTALVYASLLHVVSLGLSVVFGDIQNGIKYAVGARDEARPFVGLAGRFDRALNNSHGALTIFGIAVLAVTLADKSTFITVYSAWIYVFARAAYLVTYALGVSYLRSAVWAVALAATVILLFSALV